MTNSGFYLDSCYYHPGYELRIMTTDNPAIMIQSANPTDDWAVRQLFYDLHGFNAELDPRFALADGWERVLSEHLGHVRTTGHGLTLLAWQGSVPVGLLMMGVHTDSPLFRYRHWAELLAIYVVPSLRGSPLGERLVALGAAWAHENGYERVQLYVTAANAAAKRFYTRAGFHPVQEIWRRELGPATVPPPDDPIWETIYALDHDLLTTSSYHLLVDDEPDERPHRPPLSPDQRPGTGDNTGPSDE